MKQFTKIHFTIVKILSLISVIINFVGVIPILAFGISMIAGIQFEFGILMLVVCLPLVVVIACLQLKVFKIYSQASKMDDEFLVQNQSKIFGWGVFFAIVLLSTLIGFIIALVCIILANNYITDVANGNVEGQNKTLGETVKSSSKEVVDGTKEVFGIQDDMDKKMLQLQKAKEMFDQKVISEEEYSAMRKKILDI